MNNELSIKTQEWMKLERKTLAQRRKAEEFYDLNLMELIEEDYCQRNQERIKENVKHLIVSVGTSYEPIVLNIALFKPEKIVFLYTEKSEEVLNKVVDYSHLKASAYEKRKVNEVDPVDVYREVKEAYLKWDRPKRMYIDFTGGTKAMSAAAALAGAIIDVQMVYVASDDYLTDFRKPNPGSERLVYIDNPMLVFGDLEIDKADELYGEHNFSGAKEKYGELKESIPDPVIRQELNFVYLLSCTYEAWDALDFVSANEYMKMLIGQLDRDDRNYTNHVLIRNKKLVESQGKYLEVLSRIPVLTKEKKQTDILKDKGMIFSLMFTMWMNAVTRESQEKYDMATLLLYRLLEMIEQRCLARYGLFVSDMKYEEMLISRKRHQELLPFSREERVEWLRKEVHDLKQGLFGGRVSDYLPNPVSLLEGFILLEALRDPIVYESDTNRLNKLKLIRSKVFLRNNSIFAHGLGPVSRNDYEKFRDFVIDMFEKLCVIEHISFKDHCNIFRWISLKEEE